MIEKQWVYLGPVPLMWAIPAVWAVQIGIIWIVKITVCYCRAVLKGVTAFHDYFFQASLLLLDK